MEKVFGLIGFPLSHSFSRRYFTEKFKKEKIKDCVYQLFELERIEGFVNLIEKNPNLLGVNVTIPYKEKVMRYLDEFDDSAQKVGAVNVIKFLEDGHLKGYNSDYYGFRSSLEKWFPFDMVKPKALILGSGGASKAVAAVLKDIDVPFLVVSRKGGDEKTISYHSIWQNKNFLNDYQLIINTTPLGMSPDTNKAPDINYQALTNKHYLYDLIYNPEETLFMINGKNKGAKTKNGHEMLILQAEKSWEIWNN